MGITHLNHLRITSGETDDLRFPVQGINPPGAVSDPSRDQTDSLFEFSATATNTIAGVAQLPHSWVEGSLVYPHIHTLTTNTSGGNVVWEFKYEIKNLREAFTSSYIVTSSVQSMSLTYGYHDKGYFCFGGIDMSGKKISCMMKWILSRLGGVSADTALAVKLLEFDIHYSKDSIGSLSQGTKD